jgi:flagellar biosynthesis/type III secretory pathway M-ring protein FliF/YscJ
VPDLAVSDVVVLDETGAAVSGDGASQDIPSALDEERRAVELYYGARIRQALAGLDQAGADVAVSVGPPAEASDGGAAALASWSPQARAFPLNVTVTMASAPSPLFEQQMRRLAADAAGLDGEKGDVLVVMTAPASTPNPLAPDETVAAATPTASNPVPARATLTVLALAFAAMIGLGLVIVWRAHAAGVKGARRTRLLRNLQIALDEEHSNAPAAS